jgi:hypothetical protein
MRIAKRDRIALSVAPDLTIKRRGIVIMTGGALLCLGLGWVGASSNFFSTTPTSLRVKQVNADPAKSDRLEVPGSPTNPTATATEITYAGDLKPRRENHAFSLIAEETEYERCGTGGRADEGLD